jgi:hypothetical protein
MRVKVYRGTPSQSGRNLCETCKHSTITRGRQLREEIIRCEAQSVGTTFVTFVVTECSAYLDGKRAAGFVRSSELPPNERYELMRDAPSFEE